MVALIVELVDQQTIAGEEVLNVFHFVDPDGVGDPAVLLESYVTDVLPLARPIQSTGLSHNNIRWRTVFPADSLMLDYGTGLPVVGSDAGEPLANCDAASFKWILTNPTVVLAGGFTGHLKRGGCRLAGPTEGAVVGNACSAGFIVNARAWSNELLVPGGGAFQLAVCSFLIGDPVPDPDHPHRHLPRARSHTVTSYTIVGTASDPAPSTQNTRKILRGRIA
jgi:hypothetical protein